MDVSQDSNDSLSETDNLMEQMNVEEILAFVKDEVTQWMATYSRQIIREWMSDNAKNILRQDGIISSGGKAKTLPRKEPLKRMKTVHTIDALLTKDINRLDCKKDGDT